MNLGTVIKSIALKKQPQQGSKVEAAPSLRANEKAEPNPYLTAQRHWNSHVGSVVSVNHILIAFALIALFIACGAVGGLIRVSQMSKFIPYVVRENAMGEQTGGEVLKPALTADESEMHSAVTRFISKARLVTPDANLQRKAVFAVYSMLAPDDPATKKMNEYMGAKPEDNPFTRAEKVMVSTEIKSAIPQSPDTWQVDWQETIRDRQGVQIKPPYMMRALVTVYQTQPSKDTTEQQMEENAHNIKVRDYSWAEQN